MLALVTFIFFLFAGVFSRRTDYPRDVLENEVTSLPGLPSGLNYTMFSGYITLGNSTRNIFYWFVESLNNPVTDPLVLWTNGGPGCSGLEGFFTEQGPFRINQNLTLYVNVYSWVNIANMVFIEQPAGVGFSYATDKKEYNVDDEDAAQANYEFILLFLQKYKNFQANDFYLTSESYGGHYMPTLAQQIVLGNQKSSNPIKFKGFLVGNPYTDPVENAKGQYDTWYGHQLVSYPTYHRWLTNCSNGEKQDSELCRTAENLMNEEIGSDVDPYALDFPVCHLISSSNQKLWFIKKVIRDGLKRPIPQFYETLFKEADVFLQSKTDENSNEQNLGDFPIDGYHECEQDWMTEYLNLRQVQNAIHAVNSTIWTDCTNRLNYSDASMNAYMEPYYTWLITNAPYLRITIISGDDDSVCGTLGTQSWIWEMGYTVNSNFTWQAWFVDGQVAGYLTKFVNAFNFVTVHTAGHMIPETQRLRSLTAFTNYIKGIF